MNRVTITVANGQVVDVSSNEDIEVAVFNYDHLDTKQDLIAAEFRKVAADTHGVDAATHNWNEEIGFILEDSIR
jgi:hypothetical protein